MGLDITAYRKLVEDGLPSGTDYENNKVSFYILTEFSAVADQVKEGIAYSYEDSFGFRAGSYSGYNEWRKWLAALVGSTPEKIWEGEIVPAFKELINYSDCEGVIGAITSAKLAADFAKYNDAAKASNRNDYCYCIYQNWSKAFEMAADGGAVKFH